MLLRRNPLRIGPRLQLRMEPGHFGTGPRIGSGRTEERAGVALRTFYRYFRRISLEVWAGAATDAGTSRKGSPADLGVRCLRSSSRS